MKDRQVDVLRTVVSQYVQTGEPVSSKTVATHGDLRVSSATIRNDMGTLEDEGLIYQPHTSAGRVPTEAGYRYFVDRMRTPRPLAKPQKEAIYRFLDEAVDLEDVVSRSVRLLAQLTHSAAVVQLPTKESAKLRTVQLVDLGVRGLMVVVVTANGRVRERIIETEHPFDATFVNDLRDHLLRRLHDAEGNYVETSIDEVVAYFSGSDLEVAQHVITVIHELAESEETSRMVVGGLSNLARFGNEFEDVSHVLDALEEQVVLLRLLAEVHTNPLQVSIGGENRHEHLEQASVVSAEYNAGADSAARVGIVGPTRMDYSRSLVAVEAVSRYLTSLLLD